MVLGFLVALSAQAVPSVQVEIRKPAPRENPQPWVTEDDYPAISLGRREFGTVKFRLDLDARGDVMRCHVTGSSGYANPALLRMVYADGKIAACSVEISTGNTRLDEIACTQAKAQVPALRIEGARIAQPNSRMVEARFEAAT